MGVVVSLQTFRTYNLFVPRRFVPQESLTVALTLTVTLAPTRNSKNNT